MADNIQIVGSIISTQEISRYNEEDIRLLTSQTIQESFGKQNDYIEYFIYDAGNNLLNTNYNYKSFKSPNTSFVTPSGSLPIIEIDPIKNLQSLGYSSGEFKVQYNFFNNQISDSNADLFLKEISADRTELRIGSTILTNSEIESAANDLINQYTGSAYFTDYLVNFGNNIQSTAVNVALNKVESGYEILFKLYQPLPVSIQEKVNLWIVKEKINPYIFDINLDKLIVAAPLPQLRGPNFDINIPNQNNIATSYQTYSSLINSVQNISTTSYQQLLSLITSQSININVDYTDCNNFTFFSSAKQRVINFYDKVKQIEDYNTVINTFTALTSSNPNLTYDINVATSSINNLITNFDGFEYYLYFESGSLISSLEYGITPYPKSTTTKPFDLYSTSSVLVDVWYNAATSSADNYDNYNSNYILNTLPEFVKDDENNNQYVTFLNMVGHYFDNIWIYLQAITDVNLANNNLNQGVSKDLVYYVLQSLGTKLYNRYGDSDNHDFLIGASGSVNFDNDFTTSGSYLNAVPHKDLLAESYKRIYHNLPLLLKTKGTTYGLQTLISTFGISNQPYLTSYDAYGSASYFYTTSSAGTGITGSILKVKEYGGNTKSGLLNEYNNDKIRILSSSATGNVLSPYISIQQPTTSSTLFRTNDSHYVDISFSPQEQIDIFTSASITAAVPTWSLDDFIGDPRYQYSNSYATLDTEKEKYYSPLTASIVPFSGSEDNGSIAATDYNSFIRLIQFFDNSLFKMLNDFAPARTNLSTGITISSPILERNKWSFANPSSTSEIDTNEGNIEGPSIKTEYNNYYNSLTGSKVAYYDGNITGSQVNVYNYFENSNPNPYLFNTASWNTQHSITESANLNKFLHSDFNVTLNNVFNSVISTTRQDIEYVFGTTQSILSHAQLQDSYESLRSYQLSRYEGSKLSSLLYNTYSTSSITYVGDISYGKTAVIDQQTLKFGWVKNIGYSNLNFYDKTQVDLKYLVDPSGSLTELSKHNYNLFEVQNTFKSGTPVIVSISDPLQPSNQRSLDGNKNIWKGGFSYDPILFRELNETLYFVFDTAIGSYTENLGIKAFCDNSYEYDSYDPKTVAPSNAATNAVNGYYYKINGSYTSTTGETMAVATYDSTSWPYNSYSGLDYTTLGTTLPWNPGADGRTANGYVYAFDLLDFSNTNEGYNTEADSSTYQSNGTVHYYKVPRTSTYSINGLISFAFQGHDYSGGWSPFKVAGIIEKTTTPTNDSSWTYLGNTTLTSINTPTVDSNFYGYNSTYNTIIFDKDMHSDWSFNLNVALTGISLTAGEFVRFRFYFIDIYDGFNAISSTHWNVMQFHLNNGGSSFFEIYDSATSITKYITTGSIGQLPNIFTLDPSDISNKTILFDNSTSNFFYNSTFNPTNPTNLNYTPIVDHFSVQGGDLFRFGSFDSPASEYHTVQSSIYDSGHYKVVMDSSITKFDSNNFAILRAKPDETSIILDYKKQPGQTSQTLLIPYNIDLDVKANVGNVSSQLNNTIGSNNNVIGGSF